MGKSEKDKGNLTISQFLCIETLSTSSVKGAYGSVSALLFELDPDK